MKLIIVFYPILKSLNQAEKDIVHGSSLSETLSKHDFCPVKFIHMIKIAEEINKVEYKTTAINSLLEPLIIMFLGIAVEIILISMYLPVNRSNNF